MTLFGSKHKALYILNKGPVYLYGFVGLCIVSHLRFGISNSVIQATIIEVFN